MKLLAEKIKKSSMFTYLPATLRQTVNKMKFALFAVFAVKNGGVSSRGKPSRSLLGLKVYPAFDPLPPIFDHENVKKRFSFYQPFDVTWLVNR